MHAVIFIDNDAEQNEAVLFADEARAQDCAQGKVRDVCDTGYIDGRQIEEYVETLRQEGTVKVVYPNRHKSEWCIIAVVPARHNVSLSGLAV